MDRGVKASVEAAGGRDAVRALDDARADGEQGELLAEFNRDLDALLPIRPPVVRRGPGRPAGARNRKTQQLAAYYLGRYGDPIEALLALGTGDLAHTAREFHRAIQTMKAEGIPIARDSQGRELSGIDVNELMKLKRGALEAVLPYLHAKLAPTDDRGEPVVPILALGTVRAEARERIARGGAVSIEDLIAVNEESQSDQALDTAPATGSDDEGSDGQR